MTRYSEKAGPYVNAEAWTIVPEEPLTVSKLTFVDVWRIPFDL
ncbi:MAG TPA: hypothetical protein VKU01_19105 [Bryobacteraceae bacterium]|nr:hypothetical protein [Bryobacteraceae bacterium]